MQNELFESVKRIYGDLGVDVEKVMEKLDGIQLGIHAWQGGDCAEFWINGEYCGTEIGSVCRFHSVYFI